MADRFPSIEDIDAGETGVGSDTAAQGSFLERERALLGEDADLFAANDKPGAATVQDGDDDLLGGDDGDFTSAPAQTSGGAQNDLDDFESSFPAIDTKNDNVGPGGTITDSATPFQGGGYTNYTAPSQDEETEPIREWRAKRDADIARRDEASSRKKEETVATAQKDIDSFYESYNRKVDKQKAQTAKEAEEFLAKREDTTAGGTAWERIAKLVDLSGKGHQGGGDGSSKKRMREMLLSLKADKEAPGASGV
ncbi:Clathrin light chain [Elasticomyces elasticus]|uniref:Clathrin light chain n=1 Tax=Exophiala sideris TaxID=1016849 RepID=A0A0D1VWR4_9EURO|nr:Clathrin light chain [Elasticomyces elasticus]KAK5026436.1 Clathrin light chain [Exophiala sideris]KAK5179970.1 Clathrin light chain [Eurotiomycetes sp. CCFEE 6388]KAK5033823.1 Clathrin light chain [Exophiala sideris]KAK5055645.1 Clathrin light chain [Exophiala sideris]